MKILLASKEFINNDISHNLKTIISSIDAYSSKVDLIVFGESFLQGFDSLKFNYELDKDIAISQSSFLIKEIKKACKRNNTALSFGYFEKDEGYIYDSQMTISKTGEIVNNYRRISKGWKEKYASKEFKEGESFIKFNLEGKSFAICLCGDGWDDKNVKSLNALNVDILLWPLYIDFDANKWNKSIKYEYQEQAKRMAKNVLLVNSLNYERDSLARGGSIYFHYGKIEKEVPAGKEGILIVDI